MPETGCGVMEAAEASTALLEWDELHVLCSGKGTPSKPPYFYAHSSKKTIWYVLPQIWSGNIFTNF